MTYGFVLLDQTVGLIGSGTIELVAVVVALGLA